MTHKCETCGLEHAVDEPIVAEVAVTEATVKIAEIEAARDVTLAKIDVQREEVWQEGRVAELEGQLRGIRQTLEQLVPPAPEPEPEPVPVVIEAPPEPAAAEPAVEAPPITEPVKPNRKKGAAAWW
jgi:hypothetical protein